MQPDDISGVEIRGARGEKSILLPIPGDPEFRDLVDAWPTLPAAIKAGIMAMVRAVGTDE
jgi:hypothetical protein